MFLFPYELIPIESYPSIKSILKSENQTPITVTDMSQSGTLPPASGMEHVEPEQAPPAPPTNPIQPIAVNTTQKEVKMNIPTPFMGDRKKLEEFLKDRTAGSWKQLFWTQARENNNLGTWNEFKRVLRELFSVPDREGGIVTKMETETMSGQTADEYIERFKIYAAKSKVTQDRPLVE